MKLGCILAFVLLCSSYALPSFSKDWLFATTNWNEFGKEQVVLIDPASGQIRTLWNSGSELDAIVSPDGERLYVNGIDIDGAEALVEVDTKTGAVLRKVEVPQVIRWIHPSTPGMAISADGRWLFLAMTNYTASSSDYILQTFDTRQGRLLTEKKPISRCAGLQILPLAGDNSAVVLCREDARAKGADAGVIRLSNFVQGELDASGHLVYVAASDGQVQAVNPATHEIVRTTKDAPLRNRRVMRSSATLSPDGRLWYLPIKILANGQNEIEQILVFDTQAMTTVWVITPNHPFWALALSSDGRHLYASVPDTNEIMVIDTSMHRTVQTLPVGGKPFILFSVKSAVSRTAETTVSAHINVNRTVCFFFPAF